MQYCNKWSVSAYSKGSIVNMQKDRLVNENEKNF